MTTSPPPHRVARVKLSRSDLRALVSSKQTAKAARTKAATPATPKADADLDSEPGRGHDDVDRFERDAKKPPTVASFSTKRTGFSASAVLLGAEFAVKVNHVDPLNEGRKDVKFAWVSDGEHGKVDLESVLLRRTVGKKSRFEVQGPGISAQADDDSLPLKVRFAGLGLTTEMGEAMPHDTTPPRVELKVEVKLTDKSIGSLAALAGATTELTNLTAQLAGSEVGKAIGTVLVGAIPVISAGVAIVSARRAIAAVKDPEGTLTTKSLAIARALADATSVVFPVVGTLANIGLVITAVGLAFNEQRALATSTPSLPAAPATGPP